MSKYIEEVVPEQIKDLLHEIIIHTPIDMGQTNGDDYNRGYITYKNMVIGTVDEIEKKLVELFQSALQKQIEMIEGEVDAQQVYPGSPEPVSIEYACGVNDTVHDILSILNQYK